MSRKRERKKKEKKMPFIVATYVYACSQGQRTHSAQTKIRLHTENQPPRMSGSSLKVLLGGCGGVVVQLINLSLPT